MEEEIWAKYVEKADDNAKHVEPDKSADAYFRIQEIDNGFFEKFGNLLKDHQAREDVPRVEVPEVGATLISSPEGEEPLVIEPEEQRDVISDVIGLNIDELYGEVLYEIVHSVGADADCNDKESLFQYLQDAFKMDEENHKEAMNFAKQKEAPSIVLNVDVIQAKDLYPTDANGLSDPFVTLYLKSNSSLRYNTSVKTTTLNPCWEEHFSLPAEDAAEDYLVVEVWDFDPAETLRDKMGKIKEVKGVRGLRILMKEFAVTASTGKHDNELIGTIMIPLKSIPSSGHVKWFHLAKKVSKATKRGVIQLKLSFSSEKPSQVAAQEHRHLMRLIVLKEMESNKPDLQTWDGTFEGPADIILRQHVAQSGLRPADEKMAQWVEFIRVHSKQPLNYQLFLNIILSISDPLSNGLYSDDEMKLFWDGAKRLLPSIFLSIRKLRKSSDPDKHSLIELEAMLCIIAELSKLEVIDDIDLFPTSVYGWLQKEENQKPSIMECMNAVVKQSASEWFVQVLETSRTVDSNDENSLRHASIVTQQVTADLQRCQQYYDKIFYTRLKIPYAVTSYLFYDEKIAELVQPLVTEVCSNLKPLKFKGSIPDLSSNDDDPSTMGTALFELYLDVLRCFRLGQSLFPVENETVKLNKFHTWFHKGVAHWLDAALFIALRMISKAVDIDSLTPVDNMSKHSSSPIDIVDIFYSIKRFWDQLSWPDVEGSYTFVAKIMDDICRCSVYYADKMGAKVASSGQIETSLGKSFEITQEWCLAVNNIDHVRQAINPFTVDLGVDKIVESLSAFSNAAAADHCKETLTNVIENTIDTVNNEIIELMETIASKMSPSIKRFLLEGAEIINEENNHMHRLMDYLEANLTMLSRQLSEDNFERILSIMWENVYNSLIETVNDSLEKRRPHIFFENLNKTLDTLVGFFQQTETVEKNESYKHIKRLLSLHGMSTHDLINSFYLERFSEQSAERNSPHGMMTVKMQLINTLLRVEVLNCRNLLPHDSNGHCDPYVKIHLIPEEKFSDYAKRRTKTQKKTLFPLFDEIFTIQLTQEQAECKSAIVHFIVKDQDFLGMSSQFVAEAFIPFADIPNTTLETNIQEMKQIHLTLTKPTTLDSVIFRAIEHRSGEKLARDFIKKQKAKIQLNNNNSTS